MNVRLPKYACQVALNDISETYNQARRSCDAKHDWRLDSIHESGYV